VFANAGYEGKLVDLGEIEDEEIDKVININVLG
jgi:NAD(P)-dependent dehydrogenase (short-subunit alcohol dehydrogenase family)